MSIEASSPQAASEAAPRPKRSRWRWLGYALLLGLTLIAIGAPPLASWLLRPRLAAALSTQLGAQVELDALSLSWTMRHQARGLRVLDGSGQPMLEVPELTLGHSLSSALGGPITAELSARDARLTLRQHEERVNLERLITELLEQPSSGVASEQPTITLRLEDARVQVASGAAIEPLGEPLAATLRSHPGGLSLRASGLLEGEASARRWGEIGTQPGSLLWQQADASLALPALELGRLAPLLPPETGLGGRAEARLELKGGHGELALTLRQATLGARRAQRLSLTATLAGGSPQQARARLRDAAGRVALLQLSPGEDGRWRGPLEGDPRPLAAALAIGRQTVARPAPIRAELALLAGPGLPPGLELTLPAGQPLSAIDPLVWGALEAGQLTGGSVRLRWDGGPLLRIDAGARDVRGAWVAPVRGDRLTLTLAMPGGEAPTRVDAALDGAQLGLAIALDGAIDGQLSGRAHPLAASARALAGGGVEAELPAEARARGRFRYAQQALTLDGAIEGVSGGPIEVRTEARFEADGWRLPELRLRGAGLVLDAALQPGEGPLGVAGEGRLEADLPALARSLAPFGLPALSGRLSGRLRAGAEGASLSLEGARLTVDGLAGRHDLSLTASVDAARELRGALICGALRAGLSGAWREGEGARLTLASGAGGAAAPPLTLAVGARPIAGGGIAARGELSCAPRRLIEDLRALGLGELAEPAAALGPLQLSLVVSTDGEGAIGEGRLAGQLGAGAAYGLRLPALDLELMLAGPWWAPRPASARLAAGEDRVWAERLRDGSLRGGVEADLGRLGLLEGAAGKLSGLWYRQPRGRLRASLRASALAAPGLPQLGDWQLELTDRSPAGAPASALELTASSERAGSLTARGGWRDQALAGELVLALRGLAGQLAVDQTEAGLRARGPLKAELAALDRLQSALRGAPPLGLDGALALELTASADGALDASLSSGELTLPGLGGRAPALEGALSLDAARRWQAALSGGGLSLRGEGQGAQGQLALSGKLDRWLLAAGLPEGAHPLQRGAIRFDASNASVDLAGSGPLAADGRPLAWSLRAAGSGGEAGWSLTRLTAILGPHRIDATGDSARLDLRWRLASNDLGRRLPGGWRPGGGGAIAGRLALRWPEAERLEGTFSLESDAMTLRSETARIVLPAQRWRGALRRDARALALDLATGGRDQLRWRSKADGSEGTLSGQLGEQPLLWRVAQLLGAPAIASSPLAIELTTRGESPRLRVAGARLTLEPPRGAPAAARQAPAHLQRPELIVSGPLLAMELPRLRVSLRAAGLEAALAWPAADALRLRADAELAALTRLGVGGLGDLRGRLELRLASAAGQDGAAYQLDGTRLLLAPAAGGQPQAITLDGGLQASATGERWRYRLTPLRLGGPLVSGTLSGAISGPEDDASCRLERLAAALRYQPARLAPLLAPQLAPYGVALEGDLAREINLDLDGPLRQGSLSRQLSGLTGSLGADLGTLRAASGETQLVLRALLDGRLRLRADGKLNGGTLAFSGDVPLAGGPPATLSLDLRDVGAHLAMQHSLRRINPLFELRRTPQQPPALGGKLDLALELRYPGDALAALVADSPWAAIDKRKLDGAGELTLRNGRLQGSAMLLQLLQLLSLGESTLAIDQLAFAIARGVARYRRPAAIHLGRTTTYWRGEVDLVGPTSRLICEVPLTPKLLERFPLLGKLGQRARIPIPVTGSGATLRLLWQDAIRGLLGGLLDRPARDMAEGINRLLDKLK